MAYLRCSSRRLWVGAGQCNITEAAAATLTTATALKRTPDDMRLLANTLIMDPLCNSYPPLKQTLDKRVVFVFKVVIPCRTVKRKEEGLEDFGRRSYIY